MGGNLVCDCGQPPAVYCTPVMGVEMVTCASLNCEFYRILKKEKSPEKKEKSPEKEPEQTKTPVMSRESSLKRPRPELEDLVDIDTAYEKLKRIRQELADLTSAAITQIQDINRLLQ